MDRALPDPSDSPAPHARCLRIAITPITSSDARVWVHSFHNVVALLLRRCRGDGGFSEAIDLVCSFLILEDLLPYFSAADNYTDNAWVTPSTSPKLSGSLALQSSGIGPFTPRLSNRRFRVDAGSGVEVFQHFGISSYSLLPHLCVLFNSCG